MSKRTQTQEPALFDIPTSPCLLAGCFVSCFFHLHTEHYSKIIYILHHLSIACTFIRSPEIKKHVLKTKMVECCVILEINYIYNYMVTEISHSTT